MNNTKPMRYFIERELSDSKVFDDAQSMHSRWVQQYFQSMKYIFNEVYCEFYIQYAYLSNLFILFYSK
jgi:hypothetical protein